MKILMVLLLLPITIPSEVASFNALSPIQPEGSSPLATFLYGILTKQLSGSVGGVCFFGEPTNPWWRTVQQFWHQFSIRRNEYYPIRLCDSGLCMSVQPNTRETKCALIVMETQGLFFQQLQQLARALHWSPTAVHVCVWEDSLPLEKDHQLSSSVLTFGITRILFVRVDTQPLSFDVRFPKLFQQRLTPVTPTEAIRLLAEYNQLADLQGFNFRTLYQTLIPYLYRHETVFGGSDYKLLQTVVERLNVTHQWVYVRSTNKDAEAANMQLTELKLLQEKRVTFSLNRLLLTDANETEKLYLNTFGGVCVLVPKEPLQIFILRLWKPFSLGLWCMLLSLVLTAIVANLTMPTVFAINYIMAVLFGINSAVYRLRTLDRAILSVLDTLLFLLKESYTVKIIIHMIRMKHGPELETLEQLARFGPPLMLSPGDDATLGASLRSVPGLRVLVRDDFSTIITDWRDFFRPQFAHSVPCSYGRGLVNSQAMNEPNAYRFYLLRQKLRIQPEAFTFRRNQPFLSRVRFFIACLSEAGIYGSWLREDYYEQDRTPTLDEILRFENLPSLFYVLVFGYAIAVIVFSVEQFVSLIGVRLREKCRKRRVQQTTRALSELRKCSMK